MENKIYIYLFLLHNIAQYCTIYCLVNSYGLSENSTQLLSCYLSGRKQQIQIGSTVSDWANINKGVPQGSILGPLLFNTFINDMFYFINKGTLYNYADDKTLSFHPPDLNEIISVIEKES